jgi:hypothetical protein
MRLGVVLMVCAMAMPSQAAIGTLKATVKVVAPVPGDADAQRIPGTLSLSGGEWQLTYAILDGKANKMPPHATISVTPSVGKASLNDPARSVRKALDFQALGQVKFSAIAQNPEALGALVLVGPRLKREAKFVRDGNHQGQKIQEYVFNEGKDVFGQILYSPALGIPLKIDTYDASKHLRTFVEVDVTR